MQKTYARIGVAAAALLSFALAGCRGSSGLAQTSTLPGGALPPVQAGIDGLIPDGAHKIKHIIIVIQENRSFNNLFHDYPGARSADHGYNSKGQKVDIGPYDMATKWDVQHNAEGYLLACNGTGKIPGTDCRMNGFDKETCNNYVKCPKGIIYSHVPEEQIQPYWDMAHQYVLADEMFASNFDASSFVSHQYIIAGAANASVNYPSLPEWGCNGGPNDKVYIVNQKRQIPGAKEVVCWNRATLGSELDQKKLPWAFYAPKINSGAGIWSSYATIKKIYNGPDWKNDVSPFSPPATFLSDVEAGKLRAVTWITPLFGNSDHPGSGSDTGPSWVAQVVNAVGESKFWDSSAIFIFWDDYGGFYDAEKPSYADYDGLGIRLPLLIVSPYAKRGFVSHVHYEHGSILKFAENVFGLGQLAESDERATSPGPDCFDFSQPPRKFVRIAAPYARAFFLRQPPDYRPPDND
jgi:phospholipase C